MAEESNYMKHYWDFGAADMSKAVSPVTEELKDALRKFPPMNSAHEGYAVIAEEVDELWECVRGKQGSRDVDAMRKEAVQVAAMAIRFIVDVCDANRGQK